MEEDQWGASSTQYATFADEEAVKEAYEKEMADKAAKAEKEEREAEEDAAEARDADEDVVVLRFDDEEPEIDAGLEQLQAEILAELEKFDTDDEATMFQTDDEAAKKEKENK